MLKALIFSPSLVRLGIVKLGFVHLSEDYMSAISSIKVRGVRVLAHNRRRRDRSSQPLPATNRATLVAHSTGGEPGRYVGRHRTKRVTETVLRSRKGEESKDV